MSQPLDPMLRLGQLAQWATAGTSLARLLTADDDDAAMETDEEGNLLPPIVSREEAIAATVAMLAPVTLDAIQDAVTALSPLLDVEGRYALVATLTVEQAALALGVEPQTVRKAIYAGRLPATREGRRLRVAPADLRAYRELPRQPGGRPRKEARDGR